MIPAWISAIVRRLGYGRPLQALANIALISSLVGGPIAMAGTTLESEFRDAVAQTGPPYRAARTAVLAHGPAAAPFLDSHRSSSDWRASMTADILYGWLQSPDLFQRCTDAVNGKLIGPTPITGVFPAKRRIGEIKRMGAAVIPRLLEMLTKTGEYGGDKESEAIFGALAELNDGRAVLPLIDTMHTSPEPAIRESAASTLGMLHDERAVQPLLTVLRNSVAKPLLRAAAAMSLGQLGVTHAAGELRQLATNERLDLDLRMAAVRAIGDLGDSTAAEPLLRTLGHPHDLAYELTVVETVGKIATAAALPLLERVEKSHNEEPVRQAAKEASAAVRAHGAR